MSLKPVPEGDKPKPKATDKKPKSTRPTKFLPTERIAFAKQVELLRAYGSTNLQGARAVTNKDVSAIVKMSETTTSLANPFFVENGFLQKSETGFTPASEVVSFTRAFEWTPEKASYKLAPLVLGSWFGQALITKLKFNPMPETEAIETLAVEIHAGPEYRSQVRLLLDFLVCAGLAERDGEMIKATRTDLAGAQSERGAAPSGPQVDPARDPSIAPKAFVATSYTKPTEGVVQFHVSVRVDMVEFAGWKGERITAFFNGIAAVLAAKGAIEKGTTDD